MQLRRPSGAGRWQITLGRARPGAAGVFASYEEAMRNNDLPETAALAEKMQKLSSGPPTFINLDVVYAEDD